MRFHSSRCVFLLSSLCLLSLVSGRGYEEKIAIGRGTAAHQVIRNDRPGNVTVSAIQMSMGTNATANVDKAKELVTKAAAAGAKIILVPELFETQYFAKIEDPKYFDLARPAANHPVLIQMQALAKELAVVLPVSFFEQDNQVHYNSVAIIDADGAVLGVYRKSHIPDGPGYFEKYYFSPGDTGFKVWATAYARIGVGICWDQWMPEAARIMTLMGAELLMYPTAIGSDFCDLPVADADVQRWHRAMAGHAAVNVLPVMAANRVGTETQRGRVNNCTLTFWGASFVVDSAGAVLAQASQTEEDVAVVAAVDLRAARDDRNSWAMFRDRRPDLYARLLTLDGHTTVAYPATHPQHHDHRYPAYA